jgi:hypothetical protein
MFGWVAAARQLGAALVAFGARALPTAVGTYFEAFVLAGLPCFGAVLMVLISGQCRRAEVPGAPSSSPPYYPQFTRRPHQVG